MNDLLYGIIAIGILCFFLAGDPDVYDTLHQQIMKKYEIMEVINGN